jgi:hypothetical protein
MDMFLNFLNFLSKFLTETSIGFTFWNPLKGFKISIKSWGIYSYFFFENRIL